jgi:hypothetical protein
VGRPQKSKIHKIRLITVDWDKIAARYPYMFKTLKITEKTEQDNTCNRISAKIKVLKLGWKFE